MTPRGAGILSAAVLLAGTGLFAVHWWQRADGGRPGGTGLAASPLGRSEEAPWITDLTLVDLDRDGRLDVVFADGRANGVGWLRQQADGSFVETTIGTKVAGPAHVEVADLDQDNDHDVLVASMGIITPNNDQIGAVVVLENMGDENFVARVVQDRTYRVTDVQAGDLDGDGDLDLAVGKFGYLEGEVAWLENRGGWTFHPHALLPLAGTIHVPITDLDGDGDLDVVALVSQDWEEVYCFENDGRGRFTPRVLFGSTNKDFGSSGLGVADVDQDGDPDLVMTNGDGFDYATPGSRPWHGVQWLENDGRGRFVYHRIGDMAGAYSPCVVDVDGDGDRDLVVVSGFNDWRQPGAVALTLFENDGRQQFTARPVAGAPTHQVVVDAADLDGDGAPELVSGGFCFHPPYDRAGRVVLWRRDS